MDSTIDMEKQVHTVDIEKEAHTETTKTQTDSDSNESTVPTHGVAYEVRDEVRDEVRGEARVQAIRQSNAILRGFSSLNSKIGRLSVFEERGIERVAEDQRRPPQKLNMVFFWFSLTLSPTLIPIGMLGPIFGISINVSIVLTIFGMAIGAAVPAFCASLCPSTGLRQIAMGRYSLGIWGTRICAVLNILVNVGYGVIDAIIGGQLLSAVSGGSVTLVVGIVVVSVLAYLVSFFGFRVIHTYERYAWMVAFPLLCALWGQSHKYFPTGLNVSTDTGATFSGSCLTYFAIIFGNSAAWCTIAGDYYVHYPAKTSRWLVFGLTYVGVLIPSMFVGVLGCFFGGIISAHDDLNSVYEAGGVGALILSVMSPPAAWGKLASILFMLSFLANVTANIYSSALSIQLLGQHFLAIPRFILCTFLSLVTFALAYGGRNVLENILNNLLAILGYWTLAFALILFIEDFWFRPRLGGYDLKVWQDPKRLPMGLAGTASLLIGIGFTFLGMDQTWYVAPIAKKIGQYGGDVGDELILVSVLITYPILRTLEIKYTGR